MFEYDEGKFCAKKFLEYIESEGGKIICDKSQPEFNKRPEVPPFYDERKFKRAQEFFQNNISSMMFVSMAGLVTLLSEPSNGIQILMATNKSSEPRAAYIRYRDTIFHVMTWYDGDFSPGSKMWKSVNTVRNMHNAASQKADRMGLLRINQFMMTMTVFGFMGYAVARQNEVGLSSATHEELHALVHFWRVIGYIMGVDDRFSLCRESFEETKEICVTIVDKYLKEKILEKHPHCLMMQFAVLDGLNMVLPSLDSKALLNLFYNLVESENEENKDMFFKLNFLQRAHKAVFTKLIELSRYKIVRGLLNNQMRYALHIIKKYPEIAEHRFRGTTPHLIFI